MMHLKGLSQFDAEGVIDLSSPYEGTAERSSSSKKPHKNEEIRRVFLGGFQYLQQIAKSLLIFGLSYSRGFCSALSETAPFVSRKRRRFGKGR